MVSRHFQPSASPDASDNASGAGGGATRPGLRIGEAARRLQVSPSVLRLWERQGLINPARTSSGYRLYSEADLDVLHQVREMRAVEKVNAPGIRRIMRPAIVGSVDDAQRGTRLRQLRRAMSLSLRQAAERSGLSVGFISAVERGDSGASVATLKRLTEAYGTTLQQLFDGGPAERVVRSTERPALQLADGLVRIEQLANAGSRLESHLFVLAPQASSEGAYAHPGEELIYVLEGTVRVWLGEDEIYDLAQGDALTFPSTLPHRWLNHADAETRLIWINTPPTF